MGHSETNAMNRFLPNIKFCRYSIVKDLLRLYICIHYLNIKSLRASGRIRPSTLRQTHSISCCDSCNVVACPSSGISFLFYGPSPSRLGPASCSLPFWLPSQCCNTVIVILPSQYMSNPVPPSPPDLTADVIRVCYPFDFFIADPLLPTHS